MCMGPLKLSLSSQGECINPFKGPPMFPGPGASWRRFEATEIGQEEADDHCKSHGDIAV